MILQLLISTYFILLSYQIDFEAKVIGVVDGDTIIVLTSERQQIRIRMEGIDCPELKQDFGARAKQATVELCFDKEVTIKETGKDRYGRTLAFVYVGDLCVNKELIKQGMAWHFKKYNHDTDLEELEMKARKSKVGFWLQGNPVPPWEYRN